MTYKPNLSRKARLAAGGSRTPHPGQDPVREEELRIELSEESKPEGLIEHIWVEDITYRIAVIEVIRAQIAGFRALAVRNSYKRLLDHDEMVRAVAKGEPSEIVYSRDDRDVLDGCFLSEFRAPERDNSLDVQAMALLLGDMHSNDLAQLGQLQMYEHEEVRERDRIVNQFERRRQVAMRHAVEMVEARRRAALADDSRATTDAEWSEAEDVADRIDNGDVAHGALELGHDKSAHPTCADEAA